MEIQCAMNMGAAQQKLKEELNEVGELTLVQQNMQTALAKRVKERHRVFQNEQQQEALRQEMIVARHTPDTSGADSAALQQCQAASQNAVRKESTTAIGIVK